MKTLISILVYNHTPKHIPLGLLLLGVLLLLWLFGRRGGGRMTLGDACVAVGSLAVGAGTVIWALRWKPAVTNTTVNPVVNHTVAPVTTVIQHGGLGLWQEILIGIGIAVVLGFIGWIFRRLH